MTRSAGCQWATQTLRRLAGSPHLVVGEDGTIGRELKCHLQRNGVRVFGTTRRPERTGPDCPLLDLEHVANWTPPRRVAVAYLLAAVTSWQDCRDPRSTIANVDGLRLVAQRLADEGAFVVFVSTNLVFDGSLPHRRTTDSTCPCTEYGRHKAALEETVMAFGDQGAVVRLTKVLTAQLPLLATWEAALGEGRSIEPFSDMMLAPVTLEHAVSVLAAVGHLRQAGITHLSGDCDISYEDLANRLAMRRGYSTQLIVPQTTCESGLPLEHVPAHTTLETSSLAPLGVLPPRVDSTLDAVITQLAKVA